MTEEQRNIFNSGYSAGYYQRAKEQELLDGPDTTKYLFIGGPRHGEHFATRFSDRVIVPIIPELTFSIGHEAPAREALIRTGEYVRTKASKGHIVYVWKGPIV